MHLIQAVLMGIVQGLSEFLPISSSAHLVFTSNLYKVINNIETTHQQTGQEVFTDIMLHLGTLIAVLIYFRKDIWVIIKALLNGFRNKNYSYEFKLGIYIIIGTFISVIVAFPLSKIAEKLVFLPQVVGILLFFTGILLITSEYISKKIINKNNITLKNSILMAIAQGLAALPGFSRSGLTIATGLLSGMERTIAAKYSFLLSIPIILGASMVYPFIELNLNEILTYNWVAIIIGTLVSGIVGYLCIKYFMKFLSRFSLTIFGYYCTIIGILAIIFFK